MEIDKSDLKELRTGIGASFSDLAKILGLSGENGADAVRKMESGAKPISGPIQNLILYGLQGVDIAEMALVLPRFIIGGDMAGKKDNDWILHTRYPRFLAVVTGEKIEGLDSVTGDGLEWLSVVIWIDQPLKEPSELLYEAAGIFTEYTDQSME